MRTCHLLAASVVVGLALLVSLPSPADEAVNKEKIDKLIEQLGSGSFVEREIASKELAAIGVPALEALRKAAKSEDAEVRKRVEDMLPKIERQAESVRVLAAKRVHLVYKDAPLSEAVEDLQKKSGYSIQLYDPDGKLKERKITLDTSAKSLWHAFALFCEKAELSEASLDDLLRVPQPPGAPAGPAAAQPVMVRPNRAFPLGMMGSMGQFILKDGKAKPLPTDDRSAARIRAVSKSDQLGNVPQGEILLALEIALEPKLQWQVFQSIQIDKAVDDKDQKLTQVIPQVEGAAGIAGNPAIAVPAGPAGAQMQRQMQRMQQMQMQMQMQMQRMQMQQMQIQNMKFAGRLRIGWGELNQRIPVQLKKGAKEAKSLKELQGVITAQLLTEARPVITADNLDKAAGKTFKGDQGGSIKIVKVKTEEKQTSIQLELEQPPYDKVIADVGVRNFNFNFIAAPRPGMKIPPQPAPPAGKAPQAPPAAPPPAVQVPAGQPVLRQFDMMIPDGSVQLLESINGLSIQDDKGNKLPIDRIRSERPVGFVRQANGPVKQALIWILVCPHDKEKGKPSKVVFLGRKSVTVEIPFALKDVPLP